MEIQGENRSVTEKIISDGTEMSDSINNTETENDLFEDFLSMHRTASNETALISEIPNIINEENVFVAPGEEKKSASILSDEFAKKKHFLIFFLRENLPIMLLEIFQ